jgi:transcriptional regulator with XRE-family HTH domain
VRTGRPSKALEYTPTGQLYLGSLLRNLRQKKGVQLTALAKLLGYQPSTLSHVEINFARPSPRFLEEIARYFGVPVGELQSVPLHPRIKPKTSQRAAHTPAVKRLNKTEKILAAVARTEMQNQVVAQALWGIYRFLSEGSRDEMLLRQAGSDLRSILSEDVFGKNSATGETI